MNKIYCPEDVGFCSQQLNNISSKMKCFVEQNKIAGLSMLLAKNGKVVYHEHLGCQDLKSQVPISDNTIFRIYSMTKPIVCTALMMLYDQGKFVLSDEVSTFIPEFASLNVLTTDSSGKEVLEPLDRPVTILHLLTHTSGLSYDFLEESTVSQNYRDALLLGNPQRSLIEVINDLVKFPLAFQPGTRWHYSLSIDVVARLVEILSGETLEYFLEKNIFKPLGMEDTAFFVSKDKQHRLASMYGRPDIASKNMTFSKIYEAYLRGENVKRDVEVTYPANRVATFVRGGHGLFSTASDYLNFAQMLLNKGVFKGKYLLKPETVDLMHTNHLSKELIPWTIAGPPTLGYGFGLGSKVLLDVEEAEIIGSVGEYGWSGAARTYFWVDPKEELIGIFMCQSMLEFEFPEKDFQNLAYQALSK